MLPPWLTLILSFSRKGEGDARIIICTLDRAPTPLPLRERGRGEGASLTQAETSGN